MKKYIWYGKEEFDINKLEKFELKNGISFDQWWDKPKECLDINGLRFPFNGLWASPVDTDWGWIDWCKQNDFHLDSFEWYQTFTLKDNAKICTIDSLQSLNVFLKKYAKRVETIDYDYTRKQKFVDITEDIDPNAWVASGTYRYNWNKVVIDFDGIEVSHDFNFNLIHKIFYTWDCDSIVIWNPEIISLCHED